VADVRLEPMTDEQYRAFRAHAEDGYAQQIAESGSMAWEDAVEKASQDYSRMLPHGLATPDQFLYAAYDGPAEVGLVWVALETKSDGVHGFVCDVEVHEDFRRRGYGRAIMLAAEQTVRERGALTMGLNVFGSNIGARTLYEQLGYNITSVQMRKRL
jgi:ribosomal protein S18 acetylase RimI-like enzyme